MCPRRLRERERRQRGHGDHEGQKKGTEKEMLYSSSARKSEGCRNPGFRQKADKLGNIGNEVGLSFMKKLLPGS